MDTGRIKYAIVPLAIVLAGVFALELLPMALTGLDSLPATGLVRTLQAILIIWTTVRFSENTCIGGLSMTGAARGIKRGLLWSAGFGLLAAAAGIGLLLTGIDPIGLIRINPLWTDKTAIVLFFLVAGLIGPFAEELFFRGVIYGFLRRFGAAWAVAGSSALFVAAHSMSGIAFAHVVGALVFAFAYEYEKNIMVPITIHVLGNMALFSTAFLH